MKLTKAIVGIFAASTLLFVGCDKDDEEKQTGIAGTWTRTFTEHEEATTLEDVYKTNGTYTSGSNSVVVVKGKWVEGKDNTLIITAKNVMIPDAPEETDTLKVETVNEKVMVLIKTLKNPVTGKPVKDADGKDTTEKQEWKRK